MRAYLRGGVCLLLAAFLQGLLASVTPWGFRPELLPGVICLLGLRLGPAGGAGFGVFAGLLCALSGQGYTALALLPALGGFTGCLSPTGKEPLPRRWLLSLPGLALYAFLRFLLHLWGGVGVLTLGRTFLLSLACLPLAEVLCALCFLEKRRRRKLQGGKHK